MGQVATGPMAAKPPATTSRMPGPSTSYTPDFRRPRANCSSYALQSFPSGEKRLRNSNLALTPSFSSAYLASFSALLPSCLPIQFFALVPPLPQPQAPVPWQPESAPSACFLSFLL